MRFHRPVSVRILVILLLAATAGVGLAGGEADSLVDAREVAPGLAVEMRYATDRNFLKEVLYDDATPYLRGEVAERLARVQAALREDGLSLKIWDAYRPPAVQRKMWKLIPDPRFVADPAKGSVHNRGAAVDVTLVDARGEELDMGTDHDEFSARAYPDSTEVPAVARANRKLLADFMAREGFRQLDTEWWHFDAPGSKSYGIIEEAPRHARSSGEALGAEELDRSFDLDAPAGGDFGTEPMGDHLPGLHDDAGGPSDFDL